MATTPLNLTTALDDAAAELVLLDPDDPAAWDAARTKILGSAENAPEAVRNILKAVADKMSVSAAFPPEQKKPIIDELNTLVQDGLEQVWDKANAEIKAEPIAQVQEAPPQPPPPEPVAETTSVATPSAPKVEKSTPSELAPEPPAVAKPTAPTPSEPPPPAKPAVPEPARRALGGKFLTFFLDKEEFGFEILRVQEIISQLPITPVPRTPAHVQGVINLRGKIIPVVDLRRKLGLPPLDTQSCVIIVRAHNIEVGVAVDQVSEVSTIMDDQIDPAPSFGSGVIGEYLLGIGKIGDRVKLLLDVDRTLAPEHLAGGNAGGQTMVAMNGGGR